jgi:hypothetical protein
VYLAGTSIDLIDLSDPRAPVELGSTGPLPDTLADFAVDRQNGFGVQRSGGIQIFDLADSTGPAAVSSMAFPGSTEEVVVDGAHAYVSDGDSLRVLDLANPLEPEEVGCWDGGTIWTYVVDGGYAYVYLTGQSPDGLYVVDLSDPTSPRLVRSMVEYPMGSMLIWGGFLYGETAGTLHIFDLADHAAPELVASVFLDGNWSVNARAGDYLYLTNTWEGGVAIVDVSDPAAPVRVADLQPGGYCCVGIEVCREYAYLTALMEIYLLDVSVPAAPILLERVAHSSDAIGVAGCLPRDLLLVPAAADGLILYDASDPTSLVELLRRPYVRGLQISGSLAYAPAGAAGVDVYDLSACPQFVVLPSPRRAPRRVAARP